jgi:acyl-coenzyme A thioesterase PaaI-like protein
VLAPREVQAFFDAVFPAASAFGFVVAAVDPQGATLSLAVRPAHLRPGDTVSGPTLMTLADTAMYAALIGTLGPERGGRGVTSSQETHFLRRPDGKVLTARCRLLKVGRRLAVGAVELLQDDEPAPVAFATVTYALPEP